MHCRKSSFVKVSLFLVLGFLVTQTASASASSYVSGPTGNQTNGVFLGYASLQFRLEAIAQPSGVSTRSGGTYTYGSCVSAPGACNFYPKQGSHHYKIYQNQYGDLYFSVDGGPAGSMGGWDINEPSVYQVLFDQTVVVDKDVPNVYLYNPPNNFNTNQSVIEVSGMADDQYDSGVDHVVINSKQVAVNGNGGFSASVSLVNGLNTIEVYAVDRAGRSSAVARSTVMSTAKSSGAGANSGGANSSSTSGDGGQGQDATNQSGSILGNNYTNSTIDSTNKTSRSPWILVGLVLLFMMVLFAVLAKLGLVTVDTKKMKNFITHKPGSSSGRRRFVRKSKK